MSLSALPASQPTLIYPLRLSPCHLCQEIIAAVFPAILQYGLDIPPLCPQHPGPLLALCLAPKGILLHVCVSLSPDNAFYLNVLVRAIHVQSFSEPSFICSFLCSKDIELSERSQCYLEQLCCVKLPHGLEHPCIRDPREQSPKAELRDKYFQHRPSSF